MLIVEIFNCLEGKTPVETFQKVVETAAKVAAEVYKKPLEDIMRITMQPPPIHGNSKPHIRIFSSEPQPPDDLIGTFQDQDFSVELISTFFFPAQ